MLTPRPASGKTTYHRDGTVTYWNVFVQAWERSTRPSDEDLASMYRDERNRVMRHCGITTTKREER